MDLEPLHSGSIWDLKPNFNEGLSKMTICFSLEGVITQNNTLRAFTTMKSLTSVWGINLFRPTGHVMHQQFQIQQLYALPTLYLCVLYLSENKQRLVPLTA